MQRLLVIGCGDVARRALPQLVRRYRVYTLLRQSDAGICRQLRELGVTVIPGDLDQPATLRRLGGLADAVLHCAPPPSAGLQDTRTRHLIAALQGASSVPRRFIYISTSGVYGDCRGALVYETRTPRATTPRARRRLDAEAVLRRWGRSPGGPAISILRAPGIYAADRLPVERLRRGDPVLRAEDDVITNHIHADDLATSLLAALRRGRPQRIYHASDDTCGLAMADWFDAVADATHLPRPPRISRAEALSALPPQTLSFMQESRRLDNNRLKHELGLQLKYPDITAGLALIKERKMHSCSG